MKKSGLFLQSALFNFNDEEITMECYRVSF